MKNKLSGWVTGGLIAVAVFGVSLSNNNVASAAPRVPANMSMQQEKSMNSGTTKGQEAQKPCGEAALKEGGSTSTGMMQNGKMNKEMIKSDEIQKQCREMMEKKMADKPSSKEMIKSGEMQKQCREMMKKKMAGDSSSKEMMKNRVDDTNKEPLVSEASEQDHNAHRQV